jgi:hypothetical protein
VVTSVSKNIMDQNSVVSLARHWSLASKLLAFKRISNNLKQIPQANVVLFLSDDDPYSGQQFILKTDFTIVAGQPLQVCQACHSISYGANSHDRL